MRHLLTTAAVFSWLMIQVPWVICVCDHDGTAFRDALILHSHEDHERAPAPDVHTCGCGHNHDHPEQDPDDHDYHVVVQLESSLAGGAVALATPVVAVAPVATAAIDWRAARFDADGSDTGPPRPADPVSASDRLLV